MMCKITQLVCIIFYTFVNSDLKLKIMYVKSFPTKFIRDCFQLAIQIWLSTTAPKDEIVS